MRAEDGRGQMEAICRVLGSVCHRAGPLQVLLPWRSQMHSHFADEDTEAWRLEQICYSVSKRQSQDWSLTAEFRVCALPLCQAWVGTKQSPRSSRAQKGCPLTSMGILLLGSAFISPAFITQYPQCLEQCLAHSTCSGNLCGIKKRMDSKNS